MFKTLRLPLAALSALTLGACASQTPATTASHPVSGVDYARVSAVNSNALRTGLEVHWINYPQKPATEQTAGAMPGDSST